MEGVLTVSDDNIHHHASDNAEHDTIRKRLDVSTATHGLEQDVTDEATNRLGDA